MPKTKLRGLQTLTTELVLTVLLIAAGAAILGFGVMYATNAKYHADLAYRHATIDAYASLQGSQFTAVFKGLGGAKIEAVKVGYWHKDNTESDVVDVNCPPVRQIQLQSQTSFASYSAGPSDIYSAPPGGHMSDNSGSGNDYANSGNNYVSYAYELQCNVGVGPYGPYNLTYVVVRDGDAVKVFRWRFVSVTPSGEVERQLAEQLQNQAQQLQQQLGQQYQLLASQLQQIQEQAIQQLAQQSQQLQQQMAQQLQQQAQQLLQQNNGQGGGQYVQNTASGTGNAGSNSDNGNTNTGSQGGGTTITPSTSTTSTTSTPPPTTTQTSTTGGSGGSGTSTTTDIPDVTGRYGATIDRTNNGGTYTATININVGTQTYSRTVTYTRSITRTPPNNNGGTTTRGGSTTTSTQTPPPTNTQTPTYNNGGQTTYTATAYAVYINPANAQQNQATQITATSTNPNAAYWAAWSAAYGSAASMAAGGNGNAGTYTTTGTALIIGLQAEGQQIFGLNVPQGTVEQVGQYLGINPNDQVTVTITSTNTVNGKNLGAISQYGYGYPGSNTQAVYGGVTVSSSSGSTSGSRSSGGSSDRGGSSSRSSSSGGSSSSSSSSGGSGSTSNAGSSSYAEPDQNYTPSTNVGKASAKGKNANNAT